MIQRCIPGSISDTAGLVARLDPQAVLVFAGGASYSSSGADAALGRAVKGRSIRTIRDIPADPTVDDVNRAIAVFREDPPDLVVAVGGGSVIDLAKAVRTIGPVASDAGPFLLGDRTVEEGGPPLLAVPTTAGTGSEATRYAVFTVDGGKRPIGHPALLPEHVILDPELTYSLPPAVTASTGLDALAQAMESMWSTRSTDA
jgi:alcohol dehydrogenase class IV